MNAVCIACDQEVEDEPFPTRNGYLCLDCAADKWEAEQPEREQRTRERLDSEGYYD